MTKSDAKTALAAGKKLTHNLFDETEFIVLKNGKLHDELGNNIDDEFWSIRHQGYWEDGWEEFVEEPTEQETN